MFLLCCHNLIHLSAECLRRGALDEFSTFKYESYLKDIRSTLQSGYRPLQQLANRFEETGGHLIKIKQTRDPDIAELNHPHQIDEEIEGAQFQEMKYMKFTLSAGRDGDSCFVTKSQDIVVLSNIIRTPEDKIVLAGRKFARCRDYLTWPINYSDIGIVKVSDLEAEKRYFDIEELSQKIYLIRGDRSHLAIPLVHSISDSDDDD